jgi:hypothetical protein
MLFKLKDSTGVEYIDASVSLSKTLQSGDLTKGEKARGVIAFRVPKDATGLVLTYEPMSFDNVDRKIRFAL